MRTYTASDRAIIHLDRLISTVLGQPVTTGRATPAQDQTEAELSAAQRQHVAGLMRVNHTGEVCAQALYQGQALTAKLDTIRQQMEQAAREENDHLAWCSQRLEELHSHQSYLNPAWYVGSFAIGAAAGLAGDAWSLGFVAETEQQVVKHLDSHLQQLPPQDAKSRAVLEQMKVDELHHASWALDGGGKKLPQPMRWVMAAMSKIMTTTAYRL